MLQKSEYRREAPFENPAFFPLQNIYGRSAGIPIHFFGILLPVVNGNEGYGL